MKKRTISVVIQGLCLHSLRKHIFALAAARLAPCNDGVAIRLRASEPVAFRSVADDVRVSQRVRIACAGHVASDAAALEAAVRDGASVSVIARRTIERIGLGGALTVRILTGPRNFARARGGAAHHAFTATPARATAAPARANRFLISVVARRTVGGVGLGPALPIVLATSPGDLARARGCGADHTFTAVAGQQRWGTRDIRLEQLPVLAFHAARRGVSLGSIACT